MPGRCSLIAAQTVLFSLCLPLAMSVANDAAAPTQQDAPTRQDIDEAIAKGINFLRVTGQADDGSYTKQIGPGATALATMAVLSSGRSVDDPQVAKGLAYLQTFIQPDGSIAAPAPGITNYETSLSLECFARANKDGRYTKTIEQAANFLRDIQFDEGEEKAPADTQYGGVGYSAKSPGADLSNTAMLLDALKAAGAGPNDPAVQRALIFVSRCQNLESQHNTLKFAAMINDGGFYYSPMGEGYGAAGKDEKGALRSYGSMTYDGLKSMLYAGVTADDPRVKAATKWLRSNYSVEENPGLGQAGLYYYYHLMAKALDVVGAATFEDAAGAKHDWRAEVARALLKRQQADGSWTNPNNRWFESDPNLATSFALLALSHCREPAAK